MVAVAPGPALSGTGLTGPKSGEYVRRRAAIAATALPTAASTAIVATRRGQRRPLGADFSSRRAVATITSETFGATLSRTAIPVRSTCGAAQMRAASTRGSAHATSESARYLAARPAFFASGLAFFAIGTRRARTLVAAKTSGRFLPSTDTYPPRRFLFRLTPSPRRGPSTVTGRIRRNRREVGDCCCRGHPGAVCWPAGRLAARPCEDSCHDEHAHRKAADKPGDDHRPALPRPR